MSVLKDNEFFVQGGSFPVGIYRLSNDKLSNGAIAIKISKLVSCTIVKDEHVELHPNLTQDLHRILTHPI